MSFQNKVVIVTGSALGIGRSTAKAFLDRGARVILHGRDEEMSAKAAAELDPKLERVAFAAGDIAKEETAQRLVGKAVQQFGGVDVLINNAGYLHFKPVSFLEHTEDELDRYLNIILKGTFFACRAAIPEMRKRGQGAIVNIGSVFASQVIGTIPSSAYSVSKAAVHALTKNLAVEFAADHVRVNAIAPGFISGDQDREVLPVFNKLHLLGGNVEPGDITAAILFLSSDSASWITGTVLPVDGGVTAGRR